MSGISPNSGPTAGGTSVVITGSNFAAVQGAAGVRFGSTNATSYTVDSATQITATSPAGAPGTVDVTVTNAGGTSATGASTLFAYAAAPTATTNAASAISANAATLNATVNDNGAATSVSFDWGTSISYGNSASATPATVNAGAGSTAVTGSLSGLACNTVYHYRVSATSSEGTTQGSDVSFTAGPCVPGAPTSVVATAGVASASVAFTPPADNGGAAISGYTVTSNPGGLTGTGAASPIAVSGLNNGTAYTFTVTATNSAGTGAPSAPSSAVIPRASQTITFNNPGAQNFGTSPTLSATATSGLTPTFSSSTTGICTITSDGVLTFVTAGNCTIDADQAGDASYLPAPTVSQAFTVNPVVPGAPTAVTATAGDTQASVSFTAPTNTGGATITGYTVTANPPDVLPVNGGSSPIVVTGLTNGQVYTFTVTADNVVGTGPASAASNSITPAASQTITFDNPGAQNFGTSPTLSATATSGLAPTFSSITTGVCTITSDGVLTFVTAGNCTINADQAGNANYLPAIQVSRSFTVNPVVPDAPTAVIATPGDTQASVSFTAPVSNGGIAITGYTATSNPGGLTGTAAASPIVVTGLTNGESYTFTVTATNTAGTSPPSTASSPVTPTEPIVDGSCGSAANTATVFLPTTDLCNAGTPGPAIAGTSSWSWTCTGTGTGATDATCSAPFAATTGPGTVEAILVQSTEGWEIDESESGIVPLPAPAPAGMTFLGGATKVVLRSGTPGTSAVVTLHVDRIPNGAQLYKYGKETGPGDDDTWFAYPATIDVAAGTVTYALTDGQQGDNDWAANGVIDDPVALGAPGVHSIPTLSRWGMILLSVLIALGTFLSLRRRAL
ncbi:MAG: IPTL-CTERM sorting domain-containing protein [Rhodocyclaceae bacterium]